MPRTCLVSLPCFQENQQLEIQASDQLEGGKALSMRFLPAPPGLGGFAGVWETGLVGCVFLSGGPS